MIPAFNYFDLSGTWNVTSRVALRGGISNILGKKPPLVDINISEASLDSANTFPATYDSLGRVMFVGGTVKF
jgi:outer membrane receptor protein involved in Fe transport